MAETFVLSELVHPGTYIKVVDEGLITPAAISTGNIGIVGTAAQPETPRLFEDTHVFSDYATFREKIGTYDALSAAKLNLTRGAELAFRNGARVVFARAVAEGAGQPEFEAAFHELIKEDVNILIAPELSTAMAEAVLGSIVDTAENAHKDVMAVVGSDDIAVAGFKADKRLILVTPGIQAFDATAEETVDLKGNYAAAAVAGLLSTLSPQTSPTNKVLSGVTRLTHRYAHAEVIELIKKNVLVLEQRQGVRVVRGLTTDPGPFSQITTRRIVDFAKRGIRSVSDQFLGRLNNQRVRGALQGALDGFLTTMVQDEQLVAYTVSVSATRQDELANRAIVNALLRPTFSIDFVAVTLVLE